MSDMVVSSLSAPTADVPTTGALETESADVVDPQNSKIVTTPAERKLLAVVQEILRGEPIQGKDTETYYTVLYQGKTNRWLLRFYGDKKRPIVQFIMPLTDLHLAEIKRAGLDMATTAGHIVIDKPENLMRISGLLFDALEFCRNDENFRVKKSG
jgi:hypothetical protein